MEGIDSLRSKMKGDVILKEDPRYDPARKVWNGVGAAHSPPPLGVWSVCTTCGPNEASTRTPPGNVIVISMKRSLNVEDRFAKRVFTR